MFPSFVLLFLLRLGKTNYRDVYILVKPKHNERSNLRYFTYTTTTVKNNDDNNNYLIIIDREYIYLLVLYYATPCRRFTYRALNIQGFIYDATVELSQFNFF